MVKLERRTRRNKPVHSSERTASGAPPFGEELQSSGKRGKQSTARKRAGSRHEFGSAPSTRPVSGAYGKRKRAKKIFELREEYDRQKAPRRRRAKPKPK
jgi:hypothetical protein